MNNEQKKNISSSRREFIKKASAGGLGAGLMASAGYSEVLANPVGQQPKTVKKTRITITDIKVAVIDNSPIVRVLTDAGIDGYGQIESTKPYLKPQILFYKDYLVGEDPTNVERCLMKIRRMGSFKPWGSAVSAIEFALWDIAGKAAGVPVYKLMGGMVRDHVRCYNGAVRVQRNGDNPKDYAEWARNVKALEQGFTIVKTALGFHSRMDMNVKNFYYGNVTPSAGPKDVLRRGPLTEYGLKYIVERVAALKEGLGDTVGLALDLGPGYMLSDAVRLANALEPFNLMWIEDVLTGDYTPYVLADDYLELTRSTTVPTHTGEEIYLRQNFRELIEKNAIRVVGPDPEDIGGIAELKWVAEYADLHGIMMAPHGVFDGLIGLAAHVQVGAAMPENYIAFEYPAPEKSWWYEIIEGLPDPVVKNGLIEVWDRPGLGVGFNVKAAKKYLSEEDKNFFD